METYVSQIHISYMMLSQKYLQSVEPRMNQYIQYQSYNCFAKPITYEICPSSLSR